MRRLLPLLLAPSLLACGARTQLWVPNEFALSIRQNQVCSVDTNGGPSSYSSSPGTSFRNSGILDVGVADHYELHLLLQATNLGPDPTDVSGVSFDGVHVHAARPADAGGQDNFVVDYDLATNQLVPVGSAPNAPGYALFSFSALDATQTAALYARFCGTVARDSAAGMCRSVRARASAQTLELTVTPIAHLDGAHVTTSEYRFPLTVCCGCLVGQDSNDPFGPQPNCNRPPIVNPMGPRTGFPIQVCAVGQDDDFSCSLCAAHNLWCQPVCPGTP